jgi:hypothetical protein
VDLRRTVRDLPFNPWLIVVAAMVVLTIVFLVSRRIRTILTAKAVVRPTASAGDHKLDIVKLTTNPATIATFAFARPMW